MQDSVRSGPPCTPALLPVARLVPWRKLATYCMPADLSAKILSVTLVHPQQPKYEGMGTPTPTEPSCFPRFPSLRFSDFPTATAVMTYERLSEQHSMNRECSAFPQASTCVVYLMPAG